MNAEEEASLVCYKTMLATANFNNPEEVVIIGVMAFRPRREM